jgi:hypothetical protein
MYSIDGINKISLPDSYSAPKSELDLFVVPSTNTSIEEGSWGEYLPISSLEGIDLSKTSLHLVASIRSKSDNKIIQIQDHVVAPVNNFFHSLFSQIDVDFNGTNFETSNNTYAYKAYLTDLLNFGEDSKNTILQSSLFYKDTAGKMDELSIASEITKTENVEGGQPITTTIKQKINEGLKKRRDIIMSSNGVIDMISKIHCDIFNSNKYLLDNVSMNVKFSRSKDEFCLMSNNDSFSVKIDKAVLLVRKVQISPSVIVGHSLALEKTTAKYPIKRVQVKSFIIEQAVSNSIVNNVNSTVLPNRIVIGLVENSSYNGSFRKNPFNFQHFNLNKIAILVNSKNAVYNKPIELDFTNGKYIRGYYSLFEGIDKPIFATGNGISREDYAQGYTLFAFDLTPDLSSSEEFNLLKTGNLSIDLSFKEPLTSPLSLIAYLEFDNMIEINSKRQVTLDYQV